VIVGAAFVPATPLLVPEVAQGAASELDEVRTASLTAIRRVASDAATVVVVGAGPHPGFYPPGSRGTLAGFGVTGSISLPGGGVSDLVFRQPMSPELTVGAWLVTAALGTRVTASARMVTVDEASIALGDRDVALVIVGDGSARRSTAAPGYLDERAEGYDAAVVKALGAGPDELAAAVEDVALGQELLVGGVAAWRAAAAVLTGSPWSCEVLFDAAPFGVGYVVAAWTAPNTP
jgi:hypothetical protein